VPFLGTECKPLAISSSAPASILAHDSTQVKLIWVLLPEGLESESLWKTEAEDVSWLSFSSVPPSSG